MKRIIFIIMVISLAIFILIFKKQLKEIPKDEMIITVEEKE